MRTAIGLFTLCRAVAGLSAQDTVAAAATNAKTLSISIHSSRMANPRFSSTWFCTSGMCRVWVQFQRNGVVNTARFDIPVKPLE
jgi:hypothetical protein